MRSYYVTGEKFYDRINPCLMNTTVYKECTFIEVVFDFYHSDTFTSKIRFENCIFESACLLNFIQFDGIVRFENCSFRSATVFSGEIGKNGNIKFVKCRGLATRMFPRLKNCNQTLSEMGLYQVFRKQIFNSKVEETVYKKVGIFTWDDIGRDIFIGYAIAELTIPKGAVRYGYRKDKCRCEKAIVSRIMPYDSISSYKVDLGLCRFASMKDFGHTVYEVGKEVKPDCFDYIPNRCSNGIHYFNYLSLAEDYNFT